MQKVRTQSVRKGYWLAVIQWWLCGFTLAWHDHTCKQSLTLQYTLILATGGRWHTGTLEHTVCSQNYTKYVISSCEWVKISRLWETSISMEHIHPIWMTFFSLATQIFAKTPPHIIIIVIDDLGNQNSFLIILQLDFFQVIMMCHGIMKILS